MHSAHCITAPWSALHSALLWAVCANARPFVGRADFQTHLSVPLLIYNQTYVMRQLGFQTHTTVKHTDSVL